MGFIFFSTGIGKMAFDISPINKKKKKKKILVNKANTVGLLR